MSRHTKLSSSFLMPLSAPDSQPRHGASLVKMRLTRNTNEEMDSQGTLILYFDLPVPTVGDGRDVDGRFHQGRPKRANREATTSFFDAGAPGKMRKIFTGC